MTLPLRIVFAGTPEFSVAPLRALLSSEHQVVGIYTQPDRPAGRGRKLTPSPVKEVALEAEIAVHQPASLKKDASARQTLAALKPDLMVVVAYGLLLPQSVLDIPRLGCVNIHASLLPRWRGAAPIQRAIEAGDEATGVAIMSMEAGLDTGPVYLMRQTGIQPEDTAASLHDRLSTLGADALMEALPGIADGSRKPVAQDDALATYASKLEKAEAEVNWSDSAVTISRKIHAFNPWPVAFTRLGSDVIRLWDGMSLSGNVSDHKAGSVVAAGRDGIDVATGEGLLRVTRLQPPGKRPMSAVDFLNARDLSEARFG